VNSTVLPGYDPFEGDWSYAKNYKCDQIEGVIELLNYHNI